MIPRGVVVGGVCLIALLVLAWCWAATFQGELPTETDPPGPSPDAASARSEGPQAALIRAPVPPVNPHPAGDLVTEAGVRVTVRIESWSRSPQLGARVLVSSSPLVGRQNSDTPDLERDGVRVIFRGESDARGIAEFECLPGEWFVRVEDREYLPAWSGPASFVAETGGHVALEYRTAHKFAGAVRLADGATALRMSWDFPCAHAPGLEPDVLSREGQRLAEAMSLPVEHAFVAVPRDHLSLDAVSCSLSILHPVIGWFRTTAPVLPLEQVGTPTLVAVPKVGEGKPVGIVVLCRDASGALVTRDDITLSGGLVAGFPSILEILAAGERRLVPPGIYTLGLKDPSLRGACSRRITVAADQTADQVVDLRLPWTPREVTLLVKKAGQPYRGPLSVDVKTAPTHGSYRSRTKGSPAGRVHLSLAIEQDNSIDIVVGSESRRLVVPALSTVVEYVVDFE